MAEFKGLEKMTWFEKGPPPDWTDEWGREVIAEHRILDRVYNSSRKKPMEERNALLRVIKEELIPINNRWRQAIRDEQREATDLCQKYNNEETGLFYEILREYEALMASLPARYPSLVPLIEENVKWAPLMLFGPGKIVCPARKDEPCIAYIYGNPIHEDGLLIKSYQAMSDRLLKKSTLQEQQIKALLRALEETGAQKPVEFAAIQQQLDDLKQPGPEEPAQPEGAGARKDPCPEANPFALIEHSSGSEFTGVFTNQAKRYVAPPKVKEMYEEDIQHILHVLAGCDFSRLFLSPPTKRQAPGYFDVVKQHHDITTISAKLESIPAMWMPHGPFHELRLMIDNYCHVFGEGSSQYRKALLLEKRFLQELKNYGEAGETAKTHFEKAPRAEFKETNAAPDDTMCTIDTQVAVDDIEAFNKAQQTGDKEQETRDKEQETGDNNREEDDQNEDANDESQETDDENESENVIDPDEQETSFAQGINNEWDSDYGDAREHSLHIEDDYFDRQDGDDHADSPVNPSPKPRDPSSPFSGEDNTIDKAWNFMDKALQYDKDVGNPTHAPVRHNTGQPGASSSAQPPRPRPDDDETGEQPAGDHSFYDQYDYPDPDETAFAAPPEAAIDELGADDTFGSLQLSSDNLDAPSEASAGEASPDNTLGSIPNPYSDDLPASPQASAGEADKEGAHASAHVFHQAAPIAAVGAEQSASHQPAPIAPMVAEPLAIQPAPLPQAQPADIGSASAKRGRESDDQDSSDDDAPLIKRRKMAGKAPASVATQGQAPASVAAQGKAPASVSASPSRKRSRDDSDVDSDEVAEQPSKRQRKTPSKDNAPAAAAKGKAPATPSQRKTSTAAPKDKGKAIAAPVASSSRKRSRDEVDEEDGGDNYAPEQSAKRQKPSPALAQAPIAAAPAAAEASGDYPLDTIQNLEARIDVARGLERRQLKAQRLQLLQLPDPGDAPSPAWEPITPERAVTPERADTDGHRSMSPERAEPAVAGPSREAAADEPQREPATTGLGLTDQGTITVMQLHRMSKYRKTNNSKGAIANRPWVFGHSIGDQYALYVMRCPSRGCPKANYDVGPDEFRKHPLRDLMPVVHLEECCGDYGGGDDDVMVRKYCKQVISDDKKAVSIEWARKWNNDLINEYGNYPDADGADNDLRSHNFRPPPAAE